MRANSIWVEYVNITNITLRPCKDQVAMKSNPFNTPSTNTKKNICQREFPIFFLYCYTNISRSKTQNGRLLSDFFFKFVKCEKKLKNIFE